MKALEDPAPELAFNYSVIGLGPLCCKQSKQPGFVCVALHGAEILTPTSLEVLVQLWAGFPALSSGG